MPPLRRSERLRHSSLSNNNREERRRNKKTPPTRRPLYPVEAADPAENTHLDMSFPGRFWRPPGMSKPHAARWEGFPARCTFFLEVLVKQKREGHMGSGPPSNIVMNALIKGFWDMFGLYYDSKQLRNHYNNKRSQWGILCRLRSQTGISWDNEKKMVIADPDWWEQNDDGSGMRFFEGKEVADYDLMEEVFKGRHAQGLLLHDPTVPRWTGTPPQRVVEPEENLDADGEADRMEEAVNDSEIPNRHVEPPFASGSGRRKKKKVTDVGSSSTWVEQMDHLLHGLSEAKEQRRVRRSMERSVSESVAMRQEDNERTEADTVLKILQNEMGLNTSERLYHVAARVLSNNLWARVGFLQQSPEQRMGFLEMLLTLHP